MTSEVRISAPTTTGAMASRRDRAAGEQNGAGDAGGDDEHAEPAADRPGGALVDLDAGPRVPDRSRLGLAVWLDGLAHGSSLVAVARQKSSYLIDITFLGPVKTESL